MLINVNFRKTTSVDGVETYAREETNEFEVTSKFSDEEKDAMKKTAQVIERLHAMDGDRVGWLNTLLDKTIMLVNAATRWQEAKLKRELLALELDKLKMRGQD